MKKDEAAAVCIQRHIRGYFGRKKYLQLLFEQFEKVDTSMSCNLLILALWYLALPSAVVSLYICILKIGIPLTTV